MKSNIRPLQFRRDLFVTTVLLTFLGLALTNGSQAASISLADLKGDERITTFEGIVGYDSFLIVANAGETWEHDDARFSHTGSSAGLFLSTRIPLTGGTNTVMGAQQRGAGILVVFDLPVSLAGATVFSEPARASFFNAGGTWMGTVNATGIFTQKFIGWAAEPGTGWIKSILFEDIDPNNDRNIAIDNLVRGSVVPLPPALYLLGSSLLALTAMRRRGQS